jgi:hypothetical protein
MNGETYEYSILQGTVYVTVLPAELKEHYDVEKGNVSHLAGRVRVTTSRESRWAEVSDGSVKVRGRKYAIDYDVRRNLATQTSLGKWSRESPGYKGGFRNDNGVQVDYKAKAWGVLWDASESVLESFEEDHPDWAIQSERLHWQHEQSRALDKAAKLRKEAEEYEAKAARYAETLAAL